MTTNQNKQAILIELPKALLHIVRKRGYLFRKFPSRDYSLLGNINGKDWVRAHIQSSEKAWDLCHAISETCKKEMSHLCYAEPEGSIGRFKDLSTPMTAPSFNDGLPDIFRSNQPNHHMAGFGPAPFSPHNPHLPGFDLPKIPGMPNIPTMPDIGGMFAPQPTAGRQAVFAQLREIPEFISLNESQQQMFETECAQLRESESAMMLSGFSAVFTIASLPDTSMRLRQFLTTAGIRQSA
jgi:hypothetical protein